MKRILSACCLLGVIFLLLYAVSPLCGSSYIPTHDGEYHIIRFIEFYRMLTSGYWFPKWAPTMNSGYGIPIFLFHYPFPNYVGSLFQWIGRNAVDALKLTLASGYLLASACSFLWLRKLFGTKAALFGTLVAGCVPYWFVDLYVRGSVGEVWAIALLFMILAFVEYKHSMLIAFGVAALILSHNILAMLFIPFLIGYMSMRNRFGIKSVFLGILLSAYFWIPALWEQRYVVGLNTVNFREHFVQLYELIIPSWGTEFSGNIFGGNKISFQIGIIPFFIFIYAIILFFRSKKDSMHTLILFIFCVAGLAIIGMMPIMAFFWEHIILVRFIQYPWRLLSFMIPCVAVLSAYVASKNTHTLFLLCVGGAAFFFSFRYMHPVRYAPRDTWYYISRPNFTDGTSSMGNSFSTIWTGWKQKRPTYLIEIINGKVSGGITTNTFLTKAFTVLSPYGSDVQLSVLYYPGWEVLVDGKSVPIDYRTDGTIRFFVEPGNHAIIVHFIDTPVRIIAQGVSLVTLVWLIGWSILGIYERRYTYASRLKQT